MKLFKKKEAKNSCCCNGGCTPLQPQNKEQIKKEEIIIVLGSGCAKCHALEQSAQEAIHQLGLNIEIQHITDFTEIATYGVMSTPALVYNGKVVSYGKVLSVEEVKNILQSNI